MWLERPRAKIEDGDSLIFFNFRADRARQICQSLVDEVMPKFTAPLAAGNISWSV